jgi:hypothetical protein
MIARISRGSDLDATLRYLYGPGHRDPHHDPHLVAGFRPPAWLEPPVREDGTRDLRELTELLIQPIVALHNPGNSLLVWRCSLRTAPTDRRLSDSEWADITSVVLTRTGLGWGGVRWIAVRHATDHIHVVVTLADPSGIRRRPFFDWTAVRKACRIIEERYDLRRTAPIDRTPASSPSRAEMDRAGALPPRYVLHDAIHAAAVVAADEDDFFGRLDEAGIAIHRRRDGSGDVCGYAVALPEYVDHNGSPYFFGGGTLAPDLTLPKLRHRWNHRIRTSQADPWRQAADQITAAAGELRSAASSDLAWAAADLLRALAYSFPDERLLRRAVHLYDQAAREPGGRLPPPTATGDRLRGLACDLGRSAEESDPARRDTRELFEALPDLLDAAAKLRQIQDRASQAGTAERAAAHTRQCAGHTPTPEQDRTIGLHTILNRKPERKDRATSDVGAFSAAGATTKDPSSTKNTKTREPDVPLRHRT